jgi:hypothetical protein
MSVTESTSFLTSTMNSSSTLATMDFIPMWPGLPEPAHGVGALGDGPTLADMRTCCRAAYRSRRTTSRPAPAGTAASTRWVRGVHVVHVHIRVRKERRGRARSESCEPAGAGRTGIREVRSGLVPEPVGTYSSVLNYKTFR